MLFFYLTNQEDVAFYMNLQVLGSYFKASKQQQSIFMLSFPLVAVN